MKLQEGLTRALFDDYRIERELGAGAAAIVFLARDLRHDRYVALKVLRPELALAVGADRFLLEIRTAAKLSHSGILPVFDSGEANGLLYFTMPVVEGESLRARLEREGALPVADVVRIARDVSAALAHAHQQGVVHRDVTPDNILLSGERVVLADFGIAFAVDESAGDRLTQTGTVLGTPRYMSPEQVSGQAALDGRSDQYSLACVCYEMLAGVPPFRASTARQIMGQHLNEMPAAIRTVRSDVPIAVESALERALEKNPAERFDNIQRFAEALIDESAARYKSAAASSRERALRWRIGVAVVTVISLAGMAKAVMRSTPPLRDRDWVLVADFDGPRDDPTLASSVRELFTTELNQSAHITTMPRQQLTATLRAAGLPDTTSVNSDLARELADRSAVRAVLSGNIAVDPRGYMVRARVVSTSDGHEIAAAEGVTTADSLIVAVQRLARDIRSQLGERQEELQANQLLLDIATPSLPAYRQYVNAVALKQRGDVNGSNRLLLQALQLDNGFASAMAMMGMNMIEARNVDSARVILAEALRRPTRLSATQRFRLMGDVAYAVDRDLPSAVRWYGQYLEGMPRSTGGRNNRGLYLSMLGRYEEALKDFETSADNNPFGPSQSQPAIVNSTDMLIVLGETERARAKARSLTGAYAEYAALRIATTTNQWSDAESLSVRIRSEKNIPPGLQVEATTTLAASFAARGSIRSADSLLAHAARQSNGAQRHWYENARSLLAITSAGISATTSAKTPLDVGTVMLPDSTPGALVMRGIRLALLGDSARASAYARQLAQLSTVERSRIGSGALLINAIASARAGQWAAVVSTLASTAAFGEHDALNLDRVPSIALRWIVADAYAHLNRIDSAATYMKLAVSPRRVPPGHLSLRGFGYAFGEYRLQQFALLEHDAIGAAEARTNFQKAFITPDAEFRVLRNEASSRAR